jgi:hypothetical protein
MPATNSLLTPSLIVKEALRLLDNNLVMGSLVYRDYEAEFMKSQNGHKIGATVSIDRPVRYTVRSGATAAPQDTIQGKVDVTVDTQEGVDVQFSSSDMTLSIKQFSEKYLKSAMIQLANSVDLRLMSLYNKVWNWVGTPGQTVDSFADFAKGPQRLDEMAVPTSGRSGVLSPADNWGLLGNFSGLFTSDIAKSALTKAKLPMVGGVDLYAAQNIKTHTVGTKAGTPLVNGASQISTYLATKNTNTQNIVTDGWTASSAILKAGDVFTIAGVFAVNPVSKAVLPYLQQFAVQADVSSDGAGNATVSIAPAIITSGAYQTVSAAPADNAAITVLGTASTGYPQNMIFTKEAFALVMVPMELPSGAVNPARETYKGLSARLIPYYDGTSDLDNWRLDILYGVKAVYPDLATRVSGS